MGPVILGAAGKVGQLLRPRGTEPATWLTRQDVDIQNPERLKSALQGATSVICLAGVTHGGSQPMDLNVTLAQRTLNAARAVGAGRVFLMSSAAVYGHRPAPLTEDGPVEPLSAYAKSKVAMEEMAAGHSHPNTVLRLGNIAGADAILGGWHPGFTLDSFSDGSTPRRSYIGPGVLVQVLQVLTRQAHLPPILNVAAPGAVEMGDLLNAADLVWSSRPASGETIANVTLDTDRIEGIYAFEASDSTAAGIVADWRDGTYG